MYKFKETNIPMMISTMCGEKGLQVEPTDGEVLTKILFDGLATFLGLKKDRKAKTCIRVQNTNEPLLFAGIVEYEPNTANEEQPGNWIFTITTDEKDVDECENNYDISDMVFAQCLTQMAQLQYNLEYSEYIHAHRILIITAKAILEFLDQNASEEGPVELELENFFKATIEVVNDEKVIGIEPGGEIKKRIKDDSKIEVE